MPRPEKRSFTLGGHRTSISLEEPFAEALREIAEKEGKAVAKLVQLIDQQRQDDGGLSSSVRIWIMLYYKAKADAAA
jgi:predicted DNA-binding ribbon-helix-helix protein